MNDYYLPPDGSPFTADISFCNSEDCPFVECQRHRENLEFLRKQKKPIRVSVSGLWDICGKYKGWLTLKDGKDREKTCETCRWNDEWFGTCCNGDSPYRADMTGERTSCAYWEPFSGREKIRKEVEEQLG